MNISIEEELFAKQKNFDRIEKLNNYLASDNEIISCINIRSLKANYNKLLVFINSLKIKPCIIICTETWNLDHIELYKINNYRVYYNNSRINKADGVAIYIREDINETTEILTINKLKILKTKITLVNKSELVISALYRSHDLHKTEFLLSIKELIKLNKKYKNNMIIGDLNIDILSDETIDQEFLLTVLENGYYPGINTVTRPSDINNNKGSCIDNFFTKLNKITYKTIVLETPFNDHYPIFLKIKDIKKESINKQNMNKTDFKKLKYVAGTLNWEEINQETDPNTAINKLIDKIKYCINKSKVTMKKKKPRSNWITKGIMISCQTKEKLYKIWRNDVNNETKKSNYKNYVKTLNKIINKAKTDHDKKLIEKNLGNQRNLWKIINNKIGKNGKSNSDISYLKVNDKKIHDPDEIADKLNNHFSTIGDKLRQKIVTPLNEELKMPEINTNTFFIRPITEQEVKQTILNLKNKNGGIDGINSQILKEIIDIISCPLTYIYNLCIEKEIWPEALKNAEIIPIHKAEEKHLQDNYRPISLISNLAKIFEKLIHKRMMDFFDKNKLLSKRQYGFRKNLSTSDALNHITNLIYNKLDKSDPIAITFLDLAKAFDTVDHKILLDKLYNYGIRGKAYNLITSYLSNRLHRVKVNGKTSKFKTVNTGVPQGTILGPLLFLIYINDMLSELQDGDIISYADDTAIIATGKNWSEVETKMNRYLQIIAIWLALNKLSLNTRKTVYMEFGNYCNSTPKNMNINIQNKTIARVDNTKYLGIQFDSNMKWDIHTMNIYKKKKYLTLVFYELAKIMNTETLYMLYYAFFHSVISYGIIAWGGAYKGRTTCLQRLQTRLLKIINKNNFTQQNYPLNILQTFEFNAILRHYTELKQLYLDSNKITRNKNLQIPKRHKNISIKNSYIRALMLFNKLPNDLKILNSKNIIKRKIKEWIKTI